VNDSKSRSGGGDRVDGALVVDESLLEKTENSLLEIASLLDAFADG
jgi:hypothetical protein